MDTSKILNFLKGVIVVEVEGFFIERFINLCNINNVKIWDVESVKNSGIYLKTDKSSFKSIKKIAKKTKCNAKIKKKKGMYFLLFRYRRRKISFFIAGIMVLLLIALSTFVLRIDIKGNDIVDSKKIEDSFKNAGLYIGKNTFFISKRKVIDYVRADIEDLSWVGIDIRGTTARITVVEKTKSKENTDKALKGDIIANDSGVIVKIIAESGTSKYTTGSYITKGSIAISGTIESKFLATEYVKAKGIVRIKKEDVFEQDIKYKEEIKEYTGKSKYGIGIYVKNRKYELKYLPKDKKYDININVKKINILGKEYSFEMYTYKEYNLKVVERSYEELLNIAKQKKIEYEKNLNSLNLKVISSIEKTNKTEDGIKHVVFYTIEKDIGQFLESR